MAVHKEPKYSPFVLSSVHSFVLSLSKHDIHSMSVPSSLLVQLLLHRDMCKCATILAFMATHAPFLDPVFLHIRLSALGAGKGPPHVMHHPLLFHNGSFISLLPFRGQGAYSRFT